MAGISPMAGPSIGIVAAILAAAAMASASIGAVLGLAERRFGSEHGRVDRLATRGPDLRRAA
jgi:hypothetical protein